MIFLPRTQKDIPSEEIKTGEEDDDDNGDNLLKDSNDSEFEVTDSTLTSLFRIPTVLMMERVFTLFRSSLYLILVLPGPSIQSKMVSNQQMDDIAAKLGAQWKTLAPHLEMKAAELREIETDSEDVDMQAKLLLVAWQDREGTQATVESLVAALNTAGFAQFADVLSEA